MRYKDLIKKVMFRRKIKRTNFFENVIIEDNKNQKKIIEAFYYFNCIAEISITKFVNIFSKIEQIAYPIKIEYLTKNLRIVDFIDKRGNRFFLEIKIHSDYYTEKILEYSIWDEIETNESIIIKKSVFEINRIGIRTKRLEHYIGKTDKRCVVQYESEKTIISLKNREKRVEIICFLNEEECNEIMKYLLDFENIQYDDIFSLFVNFVDENDKKKEIVSMKSLVKERVCSEITVEEGNVTSYSYTERKNDDETILYTKYLLEDLTEFISKHK